MTIPDKTQKWINRYAKYLHETILGGKCDLVNVQDALVNAYLAGREDAENKSRGLENSG